jgi:hypothetical protein
MKSRRFILDRRSVWQRDYALIIGHESTARYKPVLALGQIGTRAAIGVDFTAVFPLCFSAQAVAEPKA